MHAPPPVFEKAHAYLDIQISRPPQGRRSAESEKNIPFVTISRESGSGGSSLARLLAARLNRQQPPLSGEAPWTVFDQEIVEHMLSAQDLSPALARFMPEDKVSEITSSVGEIVGLHPNLWDLVQRTNRFLCELARRGRVILVGRGANFATSELEGGIHVRLTAPAEHRDRHMARVLQRTLREASAHNRQVEAARRAYVRSVFARDVADPIAYDLVINSAQVALDQAATLIGSLITLRTPSPLAAAAV